jgi:hypothetical protein
LPGVKIAPTIKSWVWNQTKGVNTGANSANNAVTSAGKFSIPILAWRNAQELILRLMV